MKLKGKDGPVHPGKQLPVRLLAVTPLQLNFDVQTVELALKDGIIDMKYLDKPGFLSYEGHYCVKLNADVTKDQLIAFIADARPCRTLDAFFKADKAGLVTLKYNGKAPLNHRDPF